MSVPHVQTSDDKTPHAGTPVPETEVVTRWKVACDGGEGALGHPRVWLVIPEDRGWVECPYCDKRYIIDRDRAGADH